MRNARPIIGVLAGLQELGWSLGRNVQIDVRWGGGDPGRLPSRAAELVALEPDVILGVSTPAVAALRHVTETMPIVFAMMRMIQSLRLCPKPGSAGGNITGFIQLGFHNRRKVAGAVDGDHPRSRSCRLYSIPDHRPVSNFRPSRPPRPRFASDLTSLAFQPQALARSTAPSQRFARGSTAAFLSCRTAGDRRTPRTDRRAGGAPANPRDLSLPLIHTSGGLIYYGTNSARSVSAGRRVR